MMDLRTRGLAGLLLVMLWSAAGCGPLTFVVGVTPGDQRLDSTVVESDGQAGSQRVVIVDVTGLLLNHRKNSLLREGENPVSDLTEKLNAAKHDPRVAAVILRLNTPGGTVTASDAMYREILRFKQQSDKPVVALMMDVAASGGYYVACASDTIVAYPTTITGSVGVIMQTISFKPALDRIGIQAQALTSGPNKDAGSPLSVMTDEQRAVLQKLVDNFYARFVAVVREHRLDMPADRFDELTDGRVLSGEDALAAGMVDELGDLRDAFARAKQLAKLDRADLVVYHRPLTYVGSPYAAAPAGQPEATSQINLLQLNVDAMADLEAPAGFYYLWRPQLP
ncbi:MAG: signal peptide peptidase SppA [Phycisphaeraceae bacterium]|nr:signal peptide peptidase SppA [Phycisphaeraceae bacterium]